MPFESEVICAPGNTQLSGNGISESPLTEEMRRSILSGKTERLYAWGLITYLDIFDKERTTEALASVGGPEFAKVLEAADRRAQSGEDLTGQTSSVDWQYTRHQNRAD